MPINSKSRQKRNKIRAEILSLYIKGYSQERICRKLKGKLEAGRLRNLVKENEFLSPKNFRLGSVLLFIITAFAPPLTVYARGYEYRPLLDDMIILSAIFSTPFLILAAIFYKIHDLRRFHLFTQIFLGYLGVYIVVYLNIAIQVHLLTLCVFPLILAPTFVQEYFKLRKLLKFLQVRNPN